MLQRNYQFINSRFATGEQVCYHKSMGLGSISNYILKSLFNLLPQRCRL